MQNALAPINKAVYGSIGAFIAMMLVQILATWLTSKDIPVTPDQQSMLAQLLEEVIISLLSAAGTFTAIYQAPANVPEAK